MQSQSITEQKDEKQSASTPLVQQANDVEENYYSTLEINNTASLSEIMNAYRRLVLLYHPDKGTVPSTVKFIAIDQACKVLRNPQTRAEYDKTQLSQSPRLMLSLPDSSQKTGDSTALVMVKTYDLQQLITESMSRTEIQILLQSNFQLAIQIWNNAEFRKKIDLFTWISSARHWSKQGTHDLNILVANETVNNPKFNRDNDFLPLICEVSKAAFIILVNGNRLGEICAYKLNEYLQRYSDATINELTSENYPNLFAYRKIMHITSLSETTEEEYIENFRRLRIGYYAKDFFHHLANCELALLTLIWDKKLLDYVTAWRIIASKNCELAKLIAIKVIDVDYWQSTLVDLAVLHEELFTLLNEKSYFDNVSDTDLKKIQGKYSDFVPREKTSVKKPLLSLKMGIYKSSIF